MQYEAIDKEILECYRSIIKGTKREMEEYKKMMEQPGMGLRGEGRLYRLLKKGSAREIMPAMVNSQNDK